MGSIRLGIDTGGTFTDLISFDVDTGELKALKVASTPHEPLEAFLGSIRESGMDIKDIEGLVHGTTVAVNALIERKGAKVAFVTTSGFEDVPFIQRVNRKELYNLDWDKPKSLIRSRRHCFGINERASAKGEVVKPLDIAEVDALCERLMDEGFEAVAVCFLFAYLNVQNEREMRERLVERLRDIPVSISHEVAPIWREYERASTTIADAYLKPLILGYIASLQNGLDNEGIKISWAFMKSNGGIMQASAASDNPIQLVMSGPAGGLVASHYIAGLLEIDNVITLDVGGTSADVGIVVEGELPYTTEYEVEWGIPASIPLIDIKTIGAGGGSIAWVNAGGFLQVGPQSAGADPGPVCYGKGGTEPTITDANLILGRLDPDYFLGGKRKLGKRLAEKRMKEMASELTMDTVELSNSIVEIANENMVNAIRMVSIRRGHDPRKFALITFGGAGPLHGAAIARKLGIPKVIIPPLPGNFSAFGLLRADLRVDKIWTQTFRSDKVSIEDIRGRFKQIADAAVDELKQHGYTGEPELLYCINMRYLGQNYEIEIEVPPMTTDYAQMSDAYEAYQKEYEKFYGYRLPTAVIELISFKVTAVGSFPIPHIGAVSPGSNEYADERPVYFGGHGFIPCKIIMRSNLPVMERIEGPLVVEEEGSTTLVEPEMYLTRNEKDILILEVE